MTWRNVFDLGEVDLYWVDGWGSSRPLEELPSGTISIVDGVIMIEGVPDAAGGATPPSDFVSGVAVVPKYSTAGVKARVTLSNAHIEPKTSQVKAYGGITNADEPDISFGEETMPDIEGDGGPDDPLVIVGFIPPQFEIGDMPAEDNGMPYFYFQELFG